MKRLACLITSIAVALQCTGLATAAGLADRMVEMIDGTGTTEWFYDLDGQVNKMISPQGTMEYDYYSTTGKLQYLTEIVTGGNIVTTYTYDYAGRTETIDKFGETTTFVYDDASRPEKMFYDTGAYAKYTYDGRSRISAVEHYNSSNALLRKEENTYDEASRITSRYEGPTIGGVTTTFGYDDIGQLTSESSTGYSASYAYDANGNRTNRTVNGVSETYTVDDADKLTSVTWASGGNNYSKNYAYHYSGRPTSITYKTNGVTTATETMTWDKESRMLTNSLANASYAYNGFDARVSKTVGGNTTTFKRAGADPVSPVLSDVVGATTTRYLPGISSNVGGTSTFNHSGIKNGILQTNSSQSNTATKRYDAFGDDPTTTGTWQTRFDYGGAFGYQKDSESDYKLLGHRYYDPEIGRFLTRDPIKDGRNWYAYCSNKPVTGFDPSGLFEWSRYWEDVGDMFRGYGDALWEMSTPNMILNSPKLIQAMWEDPVGTAGKVGSGLVQSFTDFSTTDMRATGRSTMNWIMALAPIGGKFGRGACFVAGTKIAMADGSSKNIEDIRVGDEVMTRDENADEDGTISIGIVADTYVRRSESTLAITFDDGSSVETTAEHPFYVIGVGFVEAGKLALVDRISKTEGHSTGIVSILRTYRGKTVYNFSVASTSTYFVMAGDEAVWVHNATACKFAPVESAAGAHSTFRRGQGGKITGYQEWWPNANNPKSGFQSGRRFRGDGKPHSGMEPPLVYPKGRGKARFPEPWELPRGY